jgi:hypothetical protein
MLDGAGADLMAACGSIVATSATLTGMFYKRIQSSENKFHSALEELNKKLNRIDKNLAVNTAFIDQILNKRRDEKW